MDLGVGPVALGSHNQQRRIRWLPCAVALRNQLNCKLVYGHRNSIASYRCKKLIIEELKDFAKNLREEQVVFALVCVGVVAQAQTDFKEIEVFEQVKNFKLQFNDKIIEILFKQKSSYYTIDLIESKEFSFMIFYNLF